jgi:hypothetical protein
MPRLFFPGLFLTTLLVVAAVGATIWWYTAQPLPRGEVRPLAPPAVEPSARLLEDHVRTIIDLGPRDHRHPDHLDRISRYIAEEFERVGVRAERQPFTVRSATYYNVSAALGPNSPSRIVVGAHYDTDGPLPGADDNASGVAALLELARMLARAPLTMKVELVAYSLEEMPYFRTEQMGSMVHAKRLRDSNVEVRAMISLEMLGYYDDTKGSQRYPAPLLKLWYPSSGNFIAVVGALRDPRLVRTIKRAMRGASPLPVHSLNSPPGIPGVDLSDHQSYWAHGYPAVMITDTAFLRNPNYHTDRDTPETLDFEKMSQAVRGVYGAILVLSEQH